MEHSTNQPNNKEPKNQEIEIRALLNPKQRSAMEASLTNKGANYLGSKHIIDMYLCPVGVKSFQEIEMHEVGSFSLRIREQSSEGKTKVEVNTKMITNEGDHNAWEEHEVSVSSFAEVVAIFHTIGFKSYFTLEKERNMYQLDNMTVCLEDIVDFGPVVEVEVIASQSESQQAKQQISQFLTSIGVTQDQFVAKSVTNMLMQEKTKF